MITLNFSVDDQLLTRTDENTVAANSHLVHVCEFAFSSEWDNRGKVATFKKRDLMLSVILDDDACTIPPEILQSENKIDVFELSVCGADGNSTITSTVVKVPILAGTWDVMSTEITPTMFEQIMQKIDEVEKGEVSPELIYEAVSEYMEAHPLEPIVAEDVAAYFLAHHDEFKGDKGDTGSTPAITATAEVGNTVGTPSVTVTKTGTNEAPNLAFNFQNLKGETGATGATPTISASATVNNSVGTPSVSVAKSGTAENPNLAFAFENLKGDAGNGIASIVKTSTSGLVDTYTITFTNGNTTTFTVSNGLGIKSADINANGHLIITYSDDTTYDAGALSDIYATTADVDAKINDVWKAQGELGAKNLLVYPYNEQAVTRNGITFTPSNNGALTISGTSTGYAYFNLEKKENLIPYGKYILSANVMDFPNAGCAFSIGLVDKSNYAFTTKARIDKTIGNSVEFEVDNTWDGYYIGVRATIERIDIVLDDYVLYPMIRFAEDPDDTWQPYAPTNYKLMQSDNILAEGLAKFGKKLWQGNFTSGSIEVEGAAKYTMFVFMLDAVACIGTIAMGGTTIMKPQATYDYQYLLYRCNTNISGDNVVLTINTSNKGGALITSTGGASQRAITAIYGLF